MLADVRDILAALHPTIADARRLVLTAGLNPVWIAFSSQSADTWASILEVAQQSGQVRGLLAAARQESPQNQALALAEQRYDQWAEEHDEPEPSSRPEPPGIRCVCRRPELSSGTFPFPQAGSKPLLSQQVWMA